MKEEVFLERKFGRKAPFSVPEGFFKEFEENLLNNLPEHTATQNKHIKPKLIKLISAAACISLVFISVYIYSYKNDSDVRKQHTKISNNMSSPASSDYVIDEISDYAMLDNYDLYSYIADE